MEKFLEHFEDQKFYCINKLTCLASPTEFYKFIKAQMKTANDIRLMSLYFGTGPLSQKLMLAISKRNKKGKRTNILLDGNRMQRDQTFFQIADTLHIRNNFKFNFLLHRLPIPKKVKELIKVLHSKLYIFDDIVVISGGNLSDSYFTDRIDRYIVIQDKNFAAEMTKIFDFIYEKNIFEYPIEEIANEIKDTMISTYGHSVESKVLYEIFNYGFDEITMSTAYINLPEEYNKIIGQKTFNLIIPSDDTNAYANSKTWDSQVTNCYRYFTQKAAEQLKNVKLNEFSSKDASFHAKGIWAFSDRFACVIAGSSNFNERSYRRDIEMNFIICTRDPNMIAVFKVEHDKILQCCTRKSCNEVKEAKSSLKTKILSKLFGKYL